MSMTFQLAKWGHESHQGAEMNSFYGLVITIMYALISDDDRPRRSTVVAYRGPRPPLMNVRCEGGTTVIPRPSRPIMALVDQKGRT